MTSQRVDQMKLVALYDAARLNVIANGFEAERDWQASLAHKPYSETDFLREGAWVILCSGFRERLVRSLFGYISLCFSDWESATEINRKSAICAELALDVFNSPRKIEAILAMCDRVETLGFETVRRKVAVEPTEYLQSFPMIGEITAKHFAKNIGFPVAKADRHLVRIALEHGYECVDSFCEEISESVQESIPVVDITLWRHGVLLAQSRRKQHTIN